MAQAPRKGSPPPRPPSPLSATAKSCSFWWARTLNTDWFQCSSDYLLKKLDSKNFRLKRTAITFSANIISATVYLFAKSSCSRGGVNTAVSTLWRRADSTKLCEIPVRGNFFATPHPPLTRSPFSRRRRQTDTGKFSLFFSFPAMHKPNNQLFYESSLVFGRSTKTFFILRKGQERPGILNEYPAFLFVVVGQLSFISE